jgi:methanogenic corrinoid protein MtbC1
VEDAALNLKQVARVLDVHYMTAYRYVRQGRLPARREGQVWMVDPADLAAFRAGAVALPAEMGPGVHGGTPVDWCERLSRPLVKADETGAWQVLDDALAAGHSARWCHVALIGGAAGRIGCEVADGRRDPVEEHIALTTATRLVAQLGARFRHRGRTRATVVFGSPPDEHHGLALAIVANVVRLEGYAVVELGTDVPIDAFLAAVTHADDVLAVGLGVNTAERLPSAMAVIEALRLAHPDLPVVVGGQGVRNDEVAGLVGATTFAADADEVVATIDRLAARRRRARAAARAASRP